MPFSALFVLVAFISVIGIFIYSLKRWSLRAAVLISGVGLVAFVAIFFIILTLTLNSM